MTGFSSLRAASAAAVLGGIFIVAPVAAQTVQCSETGTDEERIACLQSRIDALEAELARARGELEAATPAAPAAPVEEPGASFGDEQLDAPLAAPAPVAATAVAPAEPAAREGRRWLRVPFFGRDGEDESGEAPETAVAAAAPSPPPVPPVSGPESFGDEQLASVESRREAREEREVLQATIVDFQELHRGRLVVALDNGQMWRQLDVDSRQVRLRDGETYPVEIRRSAFGGYRMKIDDNNRIFSVERLR